jgi:PPOX class probable F420-dependent enzyme
VAHTRPVNAFELGSWERELVGSTRVARLATVGAAGRPHVVPVVFAFIVGRFVIAIDEKPKSGRKLTRLRNIERDNRVSLLFDRYEEDWARLAWVRVDGLAGILERGDAWPEALAALRDRYPQYRSMRLEERPLIVVEPERAVSWRAAER